eukprot:265866_1
MAAGHAFFLSNRKSFHHINKLQLLFLLLILYNLISLLAYQSILGHQYVATSLFGYGIENQFQLKDKQVKKQNDCYLDYSTNLDHDEFKDLFDCVSNILFSSALFYTYIVTNPYGSTQTHKYSYLLHDILGSTQTETHTYLAPYPLYSLDTSGTPQTQTHTSIAHDPPVLTQTLTYSHMSHSTFDSYDSTQIHTFSHIFHDTLNITKTEIHTYLAPYHLYPLDTSGTPQTQTHTSIAHDPPVLTQTLTYSHLV